MHLCQMVARSLFRSPCSVSSRPVSSLRGPSLGSLVVGVVVSAFAFGASTAQAQWSSGGSVYSDDGIEVSVDPRVVATFTVLNALGYDVESKVGPPPLFRPQFSEARSAARDAMGRPGRAVKRLAKVVRTNPVDAAKYAEAATRLGAAPRFVARDGASKLEKGLSKNLRDWYNEEGGASVVRRVQGKVGGQQKKLLKSVNTTTALVKALVRLGDEEDQLLDDSGPSGRVILSMNPLDTHGSMTMVSTSELTTIIVGPLRNSGAPAELLGAVAFAYAKTLVKTETMKGAKDGTLVDGFKTLPSLLKKNLKNAQLYGVELMACAVVKTASAAMPCTGSNVETDESKAALTELTKRFSLHVKGKDQFSVAVASLFAPLAGAAPTTPDASKAPKAPAPKTAPKAPTPK